MRYLARTQRRRLEPGLLVSPLPLVPLVFLLTLLSGTFALLFTLLLVSLACFFTLLLGVSTPAELSLASVTFEFFQ